MFRLFFTLCGRHKCEKLLYLDGVNIHRFVFFSCIVVKASPQKKIKINSKNKKHGLSRIIYENTNQIVKPQNQSINTKKFVTYRHKIICLGFDRFFLLYWKIFCCIFPAIKSRSHIREFVTIFSVFAIWWNDPNTI